MDSVDGAMTTDSIDDPILPQIGRKFKKAYNILFPEKVVEEVKNLPSVEENHTEIEAAQESVNTANEEIHEAETNVDTFVEKVEEYKSEKDSSEFYADQEEKIADKIVENYKKGNN